MPKAGGTQTLSTPDSSNLCLIYLPLGSGMPCYALGPIGTTPASACVAPATRIALFPDGCAAAAEVQAGDLILTRRADGTLAGEAVTAVRNSTQPRVLLETEDGRHLHCSLSHEIMVADASLPQGKRTVVSTLTLDDRLLSEDGTAIVLRSMTREPDGTVIQISLSGPEHLYLSEGLWSHNKAIQPWPGAAAP